MVCLNRKDPFNKAQLEYLTGILGSENAAYYVLAMNNGYSLDCDPEGKPSKLYQDILNACGGNVRTAILEKAVYYSQKYLTRNGDWTISGVEPTFVRLHGLHISNTVSQNVLQNDAYDEINQSLKANGIDDENYAMRTAIERSRQAYMDKQDGEFHSEKRQKNISKYNSRGFFRKIIGFFYSKYNKKLLTDPESEDKQNIRQRSIEEFNETLNYLILQQMKDSLLAAGAFGAELSNLLDRQQLNDNEHNVDTIMKFITIANTSGLVFTLDNTSVVYAMNMIKCLNSNLYTDGIRLFNNDDQLLRALQSKDISKFNTAQQNYINDFKNQFQIQVLDEIKSVSNPAIQEASLMWQNKDYDNVSVNRRIYDKIKAGFESRLISIQKQKRKTTSAEYLVKSKIEKLKRYNTSDSNDNYNMYLDFLKSAFEELIAVDKVLEKYKTTRQLKIEEIMYVQTDVIGFYSNIINKYISKLDQEQNGLNDSQMSNIKSLIDTHINAKLNESINLFNTVLDIYCDNAIEDYVDEYYSIGDIDAHKSVLKAALRNRINNGGIGFAEGMLGDATQSTSNIVRMIANMLNNDEREVQRESTKVGHKLLKAYSKAEKFLSKLGIDPMNSMKLYVELDNNGMPTGYFVRGRKNKKTGKVEGINYGQFEQNKKKFEHKLRLEMNLLADQHGNTIWNFDIKGEEQRYNDYMDKLDDWLEKNCNRRFTAQYYKQRRRILSRDAQQAIDEIQSQIQLLIDKCTDKNTGYVYIQNLTNLEYQRLKDLRLQKEQLSNLYNPILDDTGKIIQCEKKTGKALEIAESINEWNRFVQKNIKSKPNWTKFNDAKSKLKPADQAKFEDDNIQLKLSEEFYERLANCSTATQTEEYLKLSSSKNKIIGTVKDKRGYGIMPRILDLTDEAWDKLREIETDMARRRVRSKTKGTEKFDDIAEIKQVMLPSGADTVYNYLYQKAIAELATNPNAINEFYAKYHYIDVDGSYAPLSVFSYISPKDPSYIEQELVNGYSEMDESSPLVNENYNQDEMEAYQPLASVYANDAYDKIQSDPDAKAFYDLLLDTMDEALKMLPDSIKSSRYRMPQITANSSDIISRNMARLNIRGAVRSVSQHFTITENDSDVYREDLATRPDGSLVNNVPIRFISSLEDPSTISCDIVKTITQMFEMAKNFQLKSKTVPKCEALISAMKGGINIGTQTHSKQVERAQLELDMYGYGKMTRGFGDQNKKMTKSNKFWTKFFNNLRSVGNVALLAGNIFSAAKGFITAYYQTGTEAFVGRYYDKGDRAWTTAQMIMEIPNALRSIGQGNTHSKIQAAMQYNGLGTELEKSFGKHDKTGLRRLLSHFKMGLFTVGDYTTNAIIMMSVYHATRLVNNPVTNKLEFMTEEECIDAFNKVGKSEKEAISYFEKHSDNHLYNMYELADDGSFQLSDSVKVKIDDRELTIDPHDYVTKKVENRISGTVERRASVVNGVIAKHGKNSFYQGTLTKLLVTMRGYLFSQGWDRFKGGNDFNIKYYDDGSIREFNENKNMLFHGQYDMETGHAEYGILRSVYNTLPFVGGQASNFWHDVALATPLIRRMLSDQNRHFSKTDMQNVQKFYLDIAGLITFMLICAFIFIPPVREYPDDWWKQFLALISMGCAIETATPINPGTVLDLMSTVSTVYSYVQDVESFSTSMADVLGLNGHSPNEYVASGPYKNKPRWYRGILKAVLRPTGITGYYESFTPAIQGLDKPGSKYVERQRAIFNRIENRGLHLQDLYGENSLVDAFTTPLGVQSKYDWYNNHAWPATWLPGRKEKNNKTKGVRVF